MNIDQSIKICFQKYDIFQGRATKLEFLWFHLFCLMIKFFMIHLWINKLASNIDLLITLIILALPHICVTTRRLHDLNKSGWWIGILWIIGIILYITSEDSILILYSILYLVFWMLSLLIFYWCAFIEDIGTNQYGPNPYLFPERSEK